MEYKTNSEQIFSKVKQQPSKINIFSRERESDSRFKLSKEFCYINVNTTKVGRNLADHVSLGPSFKPAEILSFPNENRIFKGQTSKISFKKLKLSSKQTRSPGVSQAYSSVTCFETVDLTTCDIDSTDCPELQRGDSSSTDKKSSTQNSSGEQPIKIKRKRSLLENIGDSSSKKASNSQNDFFDSDQFGYEPEFLGKRSKFSDYSELASQNNGYHIRTINNQHGVKVSFMCHMRHKFSLKLTSIERGQWCKICNTMYNKIQAYVQSKNGRLVSQHLSKELQLECENLHRWTISYQNLFGSWCKRCKKERKKMVKDILNEEERLLHEKRKDRQKKLLNEARINMINNQMKQQGLKKEYLKTFRILEEEITTIASKYAREYVKTDEYADFGRVLELYRVLILPEKIFQQYFEALDIETAKKEFKKYTISLHPDKNSHPKSTAAFQKIYGVFQNFLNNQEKEC